MYTRRRRQTWKVVNKILQFFSFLEDITIAKLVKICIYIQQSNACQLYSILQEKLDKIAKSYSIKWILNLRKPKNMISSVTLFERSKLIKQEDSNSCIKIQLILLCIFNWSFFRIKGIIDGRPFRGFSFFPNRFS